MMLMFVNFSQMFGNRIQVSILAPTMYPVTSKLIRMNFPCTDKHKINNQTRDTEISRQHFNSAGTQTETSQQAASGSFNVYRIMSQKKSSLNINTDKDHRQC